jgi:polar amino acid transport system substrate-binding protein
VVVDRRTLSGIVRAGAGAPRVSRATLGSLRSTRRHSHAFASVPNLRIGGRCGSRRRRLLGGRDAVTVGRSIGRAVGRSAGRIVWCVDVSYPPEESYQADGTTPEGSDIDIANEIGKRFGVETQIDNTAFSGIIPALLAQKCDLIISGMNDTAERQQQVDFVDYLRVGQGLLVPAGNPKGITTLDDLSGKAVAVQLGTTNKDVIDAKNTELKTAGKPEIDIQTFEQDTDAFQQLSLGRVDAYSGDSPVCAYYAAKPENAGKFEVGGTPIDPIPIGIAIRKEDAEMKTAIQAVIDAMYADGTIKSIVDRWGMTDAVELLK